MVTNDHFSFHTKGMMEKSSGRANEEDDYHQRGGGRPSLRA